VIALDTNVVVRALTQDEPRQAKAAAEVLSSGSLAITKTVLLETEWVLRGAYGFEDEQVNEGLRRLVGLETLEVEDRSSVAQALAWHANGMDFADALHLASSGRAASFATFDRALAKTAAVAGARPPVEVLG